MIAFQKINSKHDWEKQCDIPGYHGFQLKACTFIKCKSTQNRLMFFNFADGIRMIYVNLDAIYFYIEYRKYMWCVNICIAQEIKVHSSYINERMWEIR